MHQLKRLIATLNREYGSPPIACHHDFGQAALNESEFAPNVRFVRPHLPTGWGRFSVVQAELAAIRLLFSAAPAPAWFIHLSAADYPIMKGSEVKNFLAEARCDAFIDARPLYPDTHPRATVRGSTNPQLDHFSSPENQHIKRRFYTSREIWIPLIRTNPRLRLGRYTIRPGWKVKGVYDEFPAFYGDHWFSGNAKVAQLLMNPDDRHQRLQRHLWSRTQTDETYFQTLLMNEPDLTICLDNRRFAEWNGGGAHPMLLGEAQLEQMFASGAFFARKFAEGAPVLDRIDARLAPPSPGPQ